MKTPAKKIYVMREGDVIINDEGRKIGVSKMDADFEHGSFEVVFQPQVPLLLHEGGMPDAVPAQRFKVSLVFEAQQFSVWRCDIDDADIEAFCSDPDTFFVPNDAHLSDAAATVKIVEDFLEYFKNRRPNHANNSSMVFNVIEDLHREARYEAERKTNG